ncbi:MAG TPA: hypothetical protein VFR38_07480 [Gaiellaceae bacterium]|nr:hypothetical protein [Gaiellaceae bacterium]
MNEQIQIDTNELFLEIARYLAAVDLYRAERCEPTWLPESAPSMMSVEHLPARAEHAPSAH